MYNPMLKTFLTVYENGSFIKASNYLMISSTAIMKQINALESHLGVKLFERRHNGVVPTPSGEAIYQEANALIARSNAFLKNLKESLNTDPVSFRVATSLMYPIHPLVELIECVKDKFPDYKIHLVSFELNSDKIFYEIANIGKSFDLCVGVIGSDFFLRHCGFLKIRDCKKVIAVPRGHRLASRQSLTLEDLHGETLLMVRPGDSAMNEQIRNDLLLNHPEIRVEETPRFYDLSVFNECVDTGKVLLSNDCWAEVHPNLVTIPVDWDYTIPMGILYNPDAPEHVLRLIRALESYLKNK